MTQKTITYYDLKQSPKLMFAFGFGSGLSKVAPGTMGTLAAIPIFFLMNALGTPIYFLLLLLALAFGSKICQYGAEYSGVHDHGGIVWDEFCGFWITMLFVPINITTLLLGFLLFRLFDIVKPWPIRVIDKKVSGGFGIMLDDVIAGVFANILLHAIVFFLL